MRFKLLRLGYQLDPETASGDPHDIQVSFDPRVESQR